jgi:hypothetical protein
VKGLDLAGVDRQVNTNVTRQGGSAIGKQTRRAAWGDGANRSQKPGKEKDRRANAGLLRSSSVVSVFQP